MTHVIGIQLQFQVILGDGIGWAHHTGIVDEHVQVVVVPMDSLRKPANGIPVHQIELNKGNLGLTYLLQDVG